MLTLEEVIRIKNEIEEMVLREPGVTGIDVANRENADAKNNEYIIRIFVRDEGITLDRLNLQPEYKEVPIELIKRQFNLQ